MTLIMSTWDYVNMDKMSDDTLRLRVEDNRLGIEKEKLDSIFDPSVQSEWPAFT